eukprot:2351319-Prymnesium_polylepis.1
MAEAAMAEAGTPLAHRRRRSISPSFSRCSGRVAPCASSACARRSRSTSSRWASPCTTSRRPTRAAARRSSRCSSSARATRSALPSCSAPWRVRAARSESQPPCRAVAAPGR